LPKIVFVCTGNTCRSPMAELLFNNLVDQHKDLDGWQAISAGVSAIPGQSASENTRKILLEEENIDSSNHLSRQITEGVLKEVELVLTMTRHHKDILDGVFPEYANKIYTLKDFASIKQGYDIIDPYGQSEEVYIKTKDEIKEQLLSIVGKLNQFIDNDAGESKALTNNYYRGDNMSIAIGSDHAGFELKKEIIKYLEEEGIEYKDMGTDNCDSVDYADFGYKVADSVSKGQNDKGILVCGTGIGMSIAANKVSGIRAALCHDVFSAKATRNHNDSNVLTLGSRVVGVGLALEIVKVWLGEEFDGGRHQKRIDKISDIERGEY